MKKLFVGIIALIALPLSHSAAIAQAPPPPQPSSCGPAGSVGLASATAFQSTLYTSNSAFVTQSNAFVGSPDNPSPYQPSGRVSMLTIGSSVDNSTVGT